MKLMPNMAINARSEYPDLLVRRARSDPRHNLPLRVRRSTARSTPRTRLDSQRYGPNSPLPRVGLVSIGSTQGIDTKYNTNVITKSFKLQKGIIIYCYIVVLYRHASPIDWSYRHAFVVRIRIVLLVVKHI